MKNLLVSLLILTLYGCASHQIAQESQTTDISTICEGNSSPPIGLEASFEAIEDKALLDKALGKPDKGGLCQGQVYKSKTGSQVTLYRAWNSTYDGTEYGKWWAFQKPQGKTSTYRYNYEICYQWSPLDKLSHCTLRPETKIVIGTGQSAECSPYFKYPVSAEKQIYIEDAANSVTACTVFNDEFSWKPAPQP